MSAIRSLSGDSGHNSDIVKPTRLTQSGHPHHLKSKTGAVQSRRCRGALSSAAPEPVLHFYLDWPTGIAEIAPHFLAHCVAGWLR